MAAGGYLPISRLSNSNTLTLFTPPTFVFHLRSLQGLLLHADIFIEFLEFSPRILSQREQSDQLNKKQGNAITYRLVLVVAIICIIASVNFLTGGNFSQ